MNRWAWAGRRSRVARLTATIVPSASGTLHAAGWPSSTADQPDVVLDTSVHTIASPDPRPPTRSPATAPTAVRPRHQMPSSSSGQKVDAATAKASPTARATPMSAAAIDTAHGTTTATTAAARNAATPSLPHGGW